MLGKPKYKVGDLVKIKIQDKTYEGNIYIIDKFGTFEDPSDVSYDIYVYKPEEILIKHIREDYVNQI